jgi:preprotein translocase subunit SecD
MNRLILTILILHTASLTGIAEPFFRVSHLEKAESEKTSRMKLSWQGTTEYLHVRNQTILTEREVVSAIPYYGSEGYGILLNLSRSGRLALKDAIDRPEGRRVGIILHGELIAAPVLKRDAINGEFLITGNFREEEVRRYAGLLVRETKANEAERSNAANPPPSDR